MNGTAARFLRLGVSLSGLVLLGWVLTGQAAKPAPEGLPTDWTHRHVIFSQPSTFEQVRRVTKDPRYWQQFYPADNVTPVVADAAARADDATANWLRWNSNRATGRRDMGSGASVGAGNYPAKYSFQINVELRQAARRLCRFQHRPAGIGNASQHSCLRQSLFWMTERCRRSIGPSTLAVRF